MMYNVKLLKRAASDLDEIYGYIVSEFKERNTAEKLVDDLEKAIRSLAEFPYRGAERKVGIYASKGYRQLFVKNYIVVYRVDEKNKRVVVVTIKYTLSQF